MDGNSVHSRAQDKCWINPSPRTLTAAEEEIGFTSHRLSPPSEILSQSPTSALSTSCRDCLLSAYILLQILKLPSAHDLDSAGLTGDIANLRALHALCTTQRKLQHRCSCTQGLHSCAGIPWYMRHMMHRMMAREYLTAES